MNSWQVACPCGDINTRAQGKIRRGVVRWAVCKGAPAGSWLDRMISRKPKMLMAMALANKMARTIWAMMTKKESYRAPIAAAT
jgi:hypothetical protein